MIRLLFMMILFLSTTYSGGFRKKHLRIKVRIDNVDNELTKLIVFIPLPQTNQYQNIKVENVYDGSVMDIPHSEDKYVRWLLSNDLPAMGTSKEFYYDIEIKLKSYEFDFKILTQYFPYDTLSETYKNYTGSSGKYINPNEPRIIEISNRIQQQSVTTVDYARNCYEYVARSYKYLKPYTGIHKLSKLLKDGGGDCGNLSSIYISLLRCKKIPSRHVVTVRPNGTFHVWSEFYLEKYGWIPVDVTYKNENLSGDYFGKYDGNGIVVTRGIWLPLDKGNNDIYYSPILQNFNWFYSCSKCGNRINAKYSIIRMRKGSH